MLEKRFGVSEVAQFQHSVTPNTSGTVVLGCCGQLQAGSILYSQLTMLSLFDSPHQVENKRRNRLDQDAVNGGDDGDVTIVFPQ